MICAIRAWSDLSIQTKSTFMTEGVQKLYSETALQNLHMFAKHQTV